jgi:hypothetical protein
MYYSLHEFNKFYTTSDHYQIHKFTIYGERHSGTNWLEKIITNTFDVPISWEYDHKHFFGCCDWNKLGTAHNTLFIGIVRNIYNWTKGMIKTPYHLERKDIFSINPWVSYVNGKELFCDSHWYDHIKYTDIFDMRHHKIEFLYLYMPYLVDNYVFVRYEDLIKDYTLIINYISYIFNLPINYRYVSTRDTSKLRINDLTDARLKVINNHTNWNTENMIGYTKLNTLDDTIYMI